MSRQRGPAAPIFDRWRKWGDQPAVIWRDETYTYAALSDIADGWLDAFSTRGILQPGTVVGIDADYSPQTIGLLFALWESGVIVALVSQGLGTAKASLYETAEVSLEAVVDADDRVRFETIGHPMTQPLLRSLRDGGDPGLILFSSGSTGRSKAVVHNAAQYLARFQTPRKAFSMIPFMMLDHIGGLNAVMYTLSSGGVSVLAPDRRPHTIARQVEQHRVQVLPTSPTFVNLMLLHGIEQYDWSSLKILTYGAERMSATTLARLRAALPNVKLNQSYGMSEIGIMHSKSESSDSLFVELGGDEFQTRVREGLLEIKAKGAMIGYLNAESPFTEDGWIRTGDRVEVRGSYFQILGRASDIIMVGSEKVYPAEVEDRLLALDGVVEAVVRGEPNAITGQTVFAKVQLSTDETKKAFRTRMREALRGHLAEFKIPTRVEVTQTPLFNTRFKRTK